MNIKFLSPRRSLSYTRVTISRERGINKEKTKFFLKKKPFLQIQLKSRKMSSNFHVYLRIMNIGISIYKARVEIKKKPV